MTNGDWSAARIGGAGAQPTRGRGRLAFLLPIAAAVVALVAAGPAEASTCDITDGAATGEELAECAANGGFDLAGIEVAGEVDLAGVVITGPFVCRNCHFAGVLSLRDAALGGRVDLRGSEFGTEGGSEVVFGAEGTVFHHIVIFSTADNQSTAHGHWLMTTASFDRVARFELFTFKGPVSFREARFSSDAGFRQAKFKADASFDGVRVGGDLDFGNAKFKGALTAVGARVGRMLDAGADYSCDVRFADAAIDGTFRLSGASFILGSADGEADSASDNGCGDVVDLEQLVVGTVFVDEADIAAISGPKVKDDISELLEATARERGDLEIANTAHYNRLWRHGSFVDKVLYGLVGGYMVRPFNPGLAIALALVIGVTLRFVGEHRRRQKAAVAKATLYFTEPDEWQFSREESLEILRSSATATWFNVWPPVKWDRKRTKPQLAGAVLVWVLLAVMLMAMANSLPIARDLVDNFL